MRSVFIALFAAGYLHADPCPKAYMFFDLGNVLVDTSVRNENGDFLKIFWRSGAVDYLNKLHSESYPIGLIVNVPEGWGISGLRDFVASLWTDPIPLDWNQFDAGVVVPEKDVERKPGPTLFCRAIKKLNGCPVFYQGEDLLQPDSYKRESIKTAASAGFISLLIDPKNASLAEGGFLPIEQIPVYLKAHPSKAVPGFCN